MKKAGILLATFLLLVSLMTACGCNGSVTTDPPSSTTTQSTTKSTAPSTTATTAPSTAPSTTKGPENPTNSTENNTSTPGMRRKFMPMG